MAKVIFNPNELIFEQVKGVNFTDYSVGKIIGRLSQIEDANIEVTSESEEVKDAVGANIDILRKGKKAKFTASNALFSSDLFAMQMGTEKKVASAEAKINVPAEAVLTVDPAKHTITLPHTPVANSVKFVYSFVNRGLAEAYELTSSAPNGKQFSISGNTITFPAEVVSGDFYVEYEYESESAVSVAANSETFPSVTGFRAYVMCRSVCDPNEKYYAIVVAKRAYLDPSSIQLALKHDGKHPFTVDFNKEYCEENADLFTIIIPK